jgi:hypothetical protein
VKGERERESVHRTHGTRYTCTHKVARTHLNTHTLSFSLIDGYEPNSENSSSVSVSKKTLGLTFEKPSSAPYRVGGLSQGEESPPKKFTWKPSAERSELMSKLSGPLYYFPLSSPCVYMHIRRNRRHPALNI